MSEGNIKLFISYSWSSPEHEEWVETLASELRESGVDVILDKWDLKEGHDSNVFMEKMVSDPEIKKVALICDQMYTEKADGRSGGVGTETQIISAEVYSKEDQNKFVAIVAERDEEGKAFLPIYYTSRIYIDLSDNDLYAKNFEQLLRWIYDKPLYIKPELGKKPAFLSDSGSVVLGTTASFKRTLDAIRNNKGYWKGALNEYIDTFTENLEKLRIQKEEGEFDDKVIESIEQFLPFRNEAIELFLALAQYSNTIETHQQLHRFFEGLLPYMDKPENVSSWNNWDFDNFKFIVHELFLYLIASFLKYECYDAVSYLLRHNYYLEKSSDPDKMVPFSRFREHMSSLDHRNNRLELRRVSLRADLLEQRSKASGIPFRQLMQADFTLYMRDCINALKYDTYQSWWPETLLYAGRTGVTFEIFARSQSKEYFNRLKCLFDVNEKKDFEPVLQAMKEKKLRVPSWDWTSFNPAMLMGYEQIETRP